MKAPVRSTPPQDAVAAIEPEAPELPEPPAEPKPLGPLRAFSDDEWKRIRGVQRFVRRAARDRKLSPSLVNGMIWVESKFERRARGTRGPRGLMQLMPRTGRLMAKRLRRKYRPYSADFNIAAGAEYLTLMLDQFDDDLQLALAAYNAGPVMVVDWVRAGRLLPKPRRPYVARVERAAKAFCTRLPMPRFEPEVGPFVCPSEQAPEPAPELEPPRQEAPEDVPEPDPVPDEALDTVALRTR